MENCNGFSTKKHYDKNVSIYSNSKHQGPCFQCFHIWNGNVVYYISENKKETNKEEEEDGDDDVQ